MSVWFVLAIILIFVEISTVNLVSIWFAIGCLLAGIVGLITENTVIQFGVFLFTSVVSLILTKPFIKKIRTRGITKTNLDRVIGQIGIVTMDIDKLEPGEVKVDGKKWMAISDKKINKDSKVEILAIDGVKLKVKEIKEGV